MSNKDIIFPYVADTDALVLCTIMKGHVVEPGQCGVPVQSVQSAIYIHVSKIMNHVSQH